MIVALRTMLFCCCARVTGLHTYDSPLSIKPSRPVVGPVKTEHGTWDTTCYLATSGSHLYELTPSGEARTKRERCISLECGIWGLRGGADEEKNFTVWQSTSCCPTTSSSPVYMANVSSEQKMERGDFICSTNKVRGCRGGAGEGKHRAIRREVESLHRNRSRAPSWKFRLRSGNILGEGGSFASLRLREGIETGTWSAAGGVKSCRKGERGPSHGEIRDDTEAGKWSTAGNTEMIERSKIGATQDGKRQATENLDQGTTSPRVRRAVRRRSRSEKNLHQMCTADGCVKKASWGCVPLRLHEYKCISASKRVCGRCSMLRRIC